LGVAVGSSTTKFASFSQKAYTYLSGLLFFQKYDLVCWQTTIARSLKALRAKDFNRVINMIHSFRDQLTEDIFDGKTVRKIDKKLAKRARMRLQLLNAAVRINDLYFPPSNKFHALKGSRFMRP